MHWAVRCIGGYVGEEWFAGFFLGLDEAGGVVKKDIGAESFDGCGFTVVPVRAIEVGVVPVVRCLADAATSVAQDFGEAAVFGSVWIVIAEVPFAEHAGGVAGVFEDFPDGDFIFT